MLAPPRPLPPPCLGECRIGCWLGVLRCEELMVSREWLARGGRNSNLVRARPIGIPTARDRGESDGLGQRDSERRERLVVSGASSTCASSRSLSVPCPRCSHDDTRRQQLESHQRDPTRPPVPVRPCHPRHGDQLESRRHALQSTRGWCLVLPVAPQPKRVESQTRRETIQRQQNDPIHPTDQRQDN